jgi:hypothetical protein
MNVAGNSDVVPTLTQLLEVTVNYKQYGLVNQMQLLANTQPTEEQE